MDIRPLVSVVLDSIEPTLPGHPKTGGQNIVVSQHQVDDLRQYYRPLHRMDSQVDVGDFLNRSVARIIRNSVVYVAETHPHRTRVLTRWQVVLGRRVVPIRTIWLTYVVDMDCVGCGDGRDDDSALIAAGDDSCD